MQDKSTVSIYNTYIWIIIVVSLILLVVLNLFLFQKFNKEEEINIQKFQEQIHAQKDILDEGMALMFHNVYMQRSFIEDQLADKPVISSTGLISDYFMYDSKLQVSSLDLDNNQILQACGNIFVDGDIRSKDMHIQNEVQAMENLFKFQKYLNENSVFESWSAYYSGNGYITLYPFASAEDNVVDSNELFAVIKDSIDQLNNLDDPEVLKNGWETDIFVDHAKQVIMFSKDLPVIKDGKVVGIVTNNIAANNIDKYINQYSEVKTYVLDSSGNLVHNNGQSIEEIETFPDLLKDLYQVDNSTQVLETQKPHLANGYYFFSLALDNANWKLVHAVPSSSINNWGLTKVLMVISMNLIIIVSIYLLISILRKNIKKLNEIEQLKSEFLMTVSHDLKAPLASIIGFTEMITHKFNKDILPLLDKESLGVQKSVNRIHRNLGIIKEEGERLTWMINSLLDLSKLESGEVEFSKENFSLQLLVKEAFEKMSSMIEEKELNYNITFETDVPDIVADRQKLLQVLINLISNAVKFTQHGNITCRVKKMDGNILLSVADTGIGIPKKNQAQIFNKFYRIDARIDIKSEGSGLGLPICKRIMDLHRGDIWVESVEGEGSTFFITIPIQG